MKAVLEDKNTGHACGGERSIIVGGEDVGGEDSGGGPLSLSLIGSDNLGLLARPLDWGNY